MTKNTTVHARTGDILLVPQVLASDATIGGLNAPSLRLAIVLATLAHHGHQGEWTIAKPLLEARAGVVLDNASRLLEPLIGAMLELKDATVPLFDVVDYTPGLRWKTAGTITVRLSFAAREMLYSQQNVVRLPLDEFRGYSTISGVILRLRLAARMQTLKTSQADLWRLSAEDFPLTGVFGSYASLAMIRRKNAAGDEIEYVSLSRAEDKLLKRGVAEINARSVAVTVKMTPRRTSPDKKARWSEITIETQRIHEVRPAKRSLGDLHRATKATKKQPALTK